MRNTSLCYIERGDEYLMLHRVKKTVDEGESPEACMLREVYEETGLQLSAWRCRGVVTFVSDEWGTEYMHLFTANAFDGELRECEEGVLAWKKKDEVLSSLPIWEGDRIFLRLLAEDRPFFLLTLRYRGDRLVEAVLNGEPTEI